MNAFIARRLTTFIHALHFVRTNRIFHPLAERLSTTLDGHIARLRTFAINQDSSRGQMLGFARARQIAAEMLREEMRTIAKVARVLDKEEHPSIASVLQTANLKVHSELLRRARTFVKTTAPLADVFVCYGCPE